MSTSPTPPAEAALAAVDPSRARRLASPLGAAALVVATTAALRLRDPHADGAWGHCPSALLGVWCPLCGGLRAVNDLTHLDVGAAASSNVLLLLALPVVLLLWVRRVVACWRGGAAAVPLAVPVGAWWALGAVALVFTVLRNLPALGWLAP